MKKHLTLLSAMTLLATTTVHAAGGHDHGSHEHGTTAAAQMGGAAMSGSMDHAAMGGSDKMFLEKKDIDGYTVSFHVMAATEGMNHGGSHNLMLKVEQGNQVINDVKINSKVVFPDGSDASKPPMKMGDWYTAGYDMGKPGNYQLMVLFKTSDGQKHFGGLSYTVK